MQNLKITIIEDNYKYNSAKKERPSKIGALKVTDAYRLEATALEGVCSAILALFPNDPIALHVSYDIDSPSS